MNEIKSTIVNGIEFHIEDNTRFGVIKEFVEVGGKILMRTDFPYGTWPIELTLEQQVLKSSPSPHTRGN